MILLVNFIFNILIMIYIQTYFTANMEQNLHQKEFLEDFKRLTDQPSKLYNYSQFIKLKKYDDYLWNFFCGNIRIYP